MAQLKEYAELFDWEKWFQQVEALYAESQSGREKLPEVDVVGLLREIREE